MKIIRVESTPSQVSITLDDGATFSITPNRSGGGKKKLSIHGQNLAPLGEEDGLETFLEVSAYAGLVDNVMPLANNFDVLYLPSSR